MIVGLTYTLKPTQGLDLNATPPTRDDEYEEFDTPETIAALAASVKLLGHEPLLLGDGDAMLRKLLDGPTPHLVLNIAEGAGSLRSREARVPAVLELLNVPCTGSDPLSLALALDKALTKRLVQAAGVLTPAWVLFDPVASPLEREEALRAVRRLPAPVFVKPAYEGSSKGVLQGSLQRDSDQAAEYIEHLATSYRQPILVEEYIEGDELTVGMIGNRPPEILGVMRVVPNNAQEPFVYSLDVKRDFRNRVRYECPAKLKSSAMANVNQAALLVWKTLGCRDVARLDFRLRDELPYFLEVNPLPGLSPHTSDLIILGDLVGLSHRDIIGRILTAASERYGLTAAGQRVASASVVRR